MHASHFVPVPVSIAWIYFTQDITYDDAVSVSQIVFFFFFMTARRVKTGNFVSIYTNPKDEMSSVFHGIVLINVLLKSQSFPDTNQSESSKLNVVTVSPWTVA